PAATKVATPAEPVLAGPGLVESKEPVPLAPDSDVAEIEGLAERLLAERSGARKITILGTASNQSITLTALAIARVMARRAKVIVVDLAGASPTIPAVSVDPNAPGLVELMQGGASFAEVITRDRLSRTHLVGSGRPGSDRALLQSPRVTLALDALLRVYDYVLLNAGSASDLPAELLTMQARAVVVPDEAMAANARSTMCDQLKAVGFNDVTMLSRPVPPSDMVDPGPRVVAA
ncbi:MAG: lipopolysaccharide biosynthesis protein, partial [Bradyrhizobium sp.]|nr:lipopolysaccharide biosynthesis protein [Bradyrhizobium sp.]